MLNNFIKYLLQCDWHFIQIKTNIKVVLPKKISMKATLEVKSLPSKTILANRLDTSWYTHQEMTMKAGECSVLSIPYKINSTSGKVYAKVYAEKYHLLKESPNAPHFDLHQAYGKY